MDGADAVTDGLLFHCPFTDGLRAEHAACRRDGIVVAGATAPTLQHADGRHGARFGRASCLAWPLQGNMQRDTGTVMMWFRPEWDWDWQDTPGRILWDVRIDHGSAMPDDPSQRYALVYPSIAGRGGGERADDTFACWRLCLATNRNRYIIGTNQRRQDKRTRQAVFSSPQHFAAGTWMHLAVSWNAGEGAVFIDGVEDRRAHLSEGLPDRPMPEFMHVGAVPSWINAGPSGMIADLRIYAVDLAAEAIAAIADIRR